MTLKMNQGEIKIFRTRCVPLRLTRDNWRKKEVNNTKKNTPELIDEQII